MRWFKLFIGIYFWSILMAAVPTLGIVVAAIWAVSVFRARRRRKFYQKFTGPAAPDSRDWDRKVKASAG